MAEPHGKYRSYATAIDTFNLPSSDIDNSGTGWVVPLPAPDEGFARSHDWPSLYREVSSNKNLALWNRFMEPNVILYADDSEEALLASSDEMVDQLTATQSKWLDQFGETRVRDSALISKLESVARMYRSHSRPALSNDVIDSWFKCLVEEAQEPGETMPSSEVIQESKRIVTRLRSQLPTDTDVYPDNDGKVAIELFGDPGHAFLLVCEPGGSALCVVTVDGVSRRARYEDSSRLPDGFVREGLRDVRTGDHNIFTWLPFDW